MLRAEKDTARKQKEGVGHGTSHRILCPAEFQAEAAVGASGSARQSSRVPAARGQEVCLIRGGSKTMRLGDGRIPARIGTKKNGWGGYGFLPDFTL